ncbi:hypothetical protein RHECNPAF_12600110 [Rhizobium etli CNPAF512]|nr:hypothetical protein RHECNPAF_12600110 [Rhizobium etli CNPAF512]
MPPVAPCQRGRLVGHIRPRATRGLTLTSAGREFFPGAASPATRLAFTP